MDLPIAGHYPSYAALTTVEELLLTLCREVLAVQQNTLFNPRNLDIIDIELDEETSTINIDIKEIRGRIVNGVIVVSEPFTNSIQNGVGTYPYNRTGLCDAIVHLALYQHSLEVDSAFNTDIENQQYITVNISTVDNETINPLTIDVSLLEYPLTITRRNSGGNISQAKPYLFDTDALTNPVVNE